MAEGHIITHATLRSAARKIRERVRKQRVVRYIENLRDGLMNPEEARAVVTRA